MTPPPAQVQVEERGCGLFVAALLLMAAAAIATLAGLQPPAPLPADAEDAAFSASRAAAILQDLYADLSSHPVGSGENRLLRGRIEERLREIGYEPEIQREIVCRSPRATCALVENVLARREGDPGRKALLVSSHYDSVPASPSVSDAGASVAAILEVSRIVASAAPLPNPVIFLINDGEEAGLLGARAFVERHPWAKDIGAVVNLEARGTSGRSWMFETSAEGGWLVGAYARSVPHPATASVAYAIYKRLPSDTDLTVYKAAGLHGLGLAFIGRVQHYHTSADSLVNLDEGSLQQQGEAALALVRELGSMDLESPPVGEAVFFDLFGLTTIWWPASWGVPLALLALLLAGAAAVTLSRAGLASPRGTVLGIGAWMLVLAVSAAAGFATAMLLGGLGAFRNTYPAHAWAPLGAAWAAGAVTAFGVVATLRRLRLWDLHAGGTVAWAILSLVLTLIDPALSYLALVPAISLAAAGLISSLTRRPAARRAVFLISLLPGAIIWLQLLFVLFGAMGEVVLPVLTILVALLAGTAAPALSGLPRRKAWIPVMSAGACFAAFAVISSVVPDATADLPERLSLGYHLDSDERVARWVLYGKAPLPASLTEASGKPLSLDRALPWWDWDETLAPAPAVEMIAPVATPVPGDSEEAALLRLRSGRGATYLEVVLPREARVTRVHYPGAGSAEVGEGAIYGEWRAFRFWGVPPEGIDVEVALTGAPPIEGWIMDRTPGLPPEGRSLLDARPASAVASQVGDATVVYRRLTLREHMPAVAGGASARSAE